MFSVSKDFKYMSILDLVVLVSISFLAKNQDAPTPTPTPPRLSSFFHFPVFSGYKVCAGELDVLD